MFLSIILDMVIRWIAWNTLMMLIKTEEKTNIKNGL